MKNFHSKICLEAHDMVGRNEEFTCTDNCANEWHGGVMRIRHGAEWMALHADGCVSRPAIGMGPSESRRVVGAVRLNNFGRVVARVSLADILARKVRDWQYKNGKQRWHIVDVDHGTYRTWMNPTHEVR
jgi:hypothetical protein